MSKKLLTKLLALTMCAGMVLQPVSAFAQEEELLEVELEVEETEEADISESEPVVLQSIMHEWIPQMNFTSNFDTIPVLGEPVTKATFDYDAEYDLVIDSTWSRIEGDDWAYVEYDNFLLGTYRCLVNVELARGYLERFYITESTSLYVNGSEWTLISKDVSNLGSKYLKLTFASDRIFIKDELPTPDPEDPEEPEVPEEPEEPEEPIEAKGKWHEKYGAKYYELPDGQKATGIQKIGEDTYLFSKNGTLQKDVFYESEGNKYFFGSDGKMVKGWFNKWSAIYYANEDGVVQTGLVDIGSDTYYFDSKGKKTTNIWVNKDSKRFYVKSDGHVAKAEKIRRWGKVYTFAADGALIE